MKPLLLGSIGCGSAIVECAFALTGVEFDYEEVSYDADSPLRARLLEVNPLGQVPALVMPDGFVMTESAAMIFHLDDLAPQAGLVPVRGDPLRPKFLRWLQFLVGAVYPTFTYGDDAGNWVGARAASRLTESTNTHRQKLMHWIEADAGKPCFLGDRFSAIDLYLCVMSAWRPGRAWYAEHCPKISAIARRTRDLPQLRAIIARHFD